MSEESEKATRRWTGKDWTIAVLAALVALLGGTLLWQQVGAAGWGGAPEPSAEEVRVFDVVLDRQDLSYIDLLFDRPIGEGREGEVLVQPPATLSPSVGGAWRWRDGAALRFEPSDRLEMATEYTLALIPERLLGPEQVLAGDTQLTVRTDQFLVEAAELYEEPAPTAGKGAVVLRGEVRFNYPVDPDELAGQLRLLDTGGEAVEVLYETTYPRTVVGLRSAALTKRPQARTLRLEIGRRLTPARGNVPLAGDFVHEIPLGSSDRLEVRRVRPTPGERDSELRITFSSPVSAEAAARHLAVEPPVAFRTSAGRNDVVLTGPFQPGESYSLRVATGLSASDGAVLGEAYETEVRLPSLPASVAFQSEGTFLTASGYRTLAVESVNTERIQLSVDRVYRNNLFTLLQYQSYLLGSSSYRGSRVPHSLGDRLADQVLKIEGARNRRVTTPLALDRFIDGEEPGFYRVAVSRSGDWQAEQRWVLITDLGMVAKRGEGEVWVWLSSFADLSPVGGARVRLLSDQNQVLAEAVSDAAGRVRLTGFSHEPGRPYLLTAEKGEDFSFLFFDQSGVDLTGLDVAGATPAKEGYDAFLYGERDLYRPGEQVEGVAVIRDRSLTAPPPMPALLVHRDPQGQERGRQRLTSDRRGLVPFRVDLPAYARTGGHTLEVVVGDATIGLYSFQVEEFIPDRIKVEIAAGEGPAPGPGEELPFQVTSAYLFGPPAAGLAVESRVRLAAATFAPEGYAAYSFTNPERSFDAVEILTESGELDGAGESSFRAVVPSGLVAPSTLEAVATARVQERGGRGVTATERVPVDPYPRYVGLRRQEEGYAEPGQPVSFDWVAVDPAGEAAAAGALRAELYHDRWNTVLRRTPEGGFRYESVRDPVLVDSRALPAGESRGTFAFTPPEYGAYRVAVTDLGAGSSAQVSFYASGWGYSPWAIESPGRVELDLDREAYAPGATATVQVRSPFPGKLLLTVEREGVLHSETHTLSDNTATLSLPVREGYRPNVYITATVIRAAGDLEPGAPARAFGAVPLSVDRSDKRLLPEVTVPEEIRPESPLTVRVATAPGAAVTVAAVDEGILRLIAQETPDPFSHFYRKLALGVGSFDTFAQLLPEVRGTAAGGDAEAARRSQFVSTAAMLRLEPVAFFSGVLEAAADGTVETRFEVPELQGSLRVMVVAVDGDRFGSVATQVRVRDRVVALPTLPRFLQTGDRLEVPVTVRNDTGRDGDFEVALAVVGTEGGESTAEARVAVAQGGEATVYLPLAVGREPGVARFTVTARGNGESTRSRARLPVRPYLPAVSHVAAGRLDAPSTTFEVPEAAKLRPGTLSRQLALGPVPSVRLGGRLRDLLRYPYGCLEQIVSRTFPLLYLADLARELDPELFAEAEPEVLVEDGLRRVAGLQTHNGGFAMWPGGTTSQPWASLYATHLLVEARRAGHFVQGYAYEEALDYAARSVRAQASYSQSELERAVYALYVLARADRADLGSMDFLRDRHAAALPPSSRGLLAAAYAHLGNPRAVAELAAGIGEVEEVERQTGGNFASALRDRALLLLALLEAVPEDERIPALADRLAREAGTGAIWTTQESAFALLALGQLFQQQAEKGAFSGRVELGGRTLGALSGETVVFRAIPGSEPLAVHLAPGVDPAAAFYSLELRGIPTDAAYRPESAGLEVERAFLTREGRPADLAALNQGDLVVVRIRVRSVVGPVDNVVVSNLLPPGLEVENPRLRSSESLPWITDATLEPAQLDLRDDCVLAFTDLPANQWQTLYTLLRAITPGTFRLPPVAAEAMYNPALRASGRLGEVRVRVE